MDEGCNQAVKEVFIRYYEEGLIYQGRTELLTGVRIAVTSISDAEVEYEDQAGHFWHLAVSADRTAAAIWSWQPPVQKPCWVILPLQ